MTGDLEASVHGSIEAVDRNQWNNLVGQSDRGTVFHRYEWLSAVERELDREAVHVVVEKDGNPVAVFPNFVDGLDLGGASGVLESVVERAPLRRLVSIDPGFGGPVVTTDTAECLDLLFDELDGHASSRTVFHSIKTYDTAAVRYGKYLAKRGFSPSLLSCRFVVDLADGWDRIEEGMHKSRRQALRSGRETAVEVDARPLAEVDLEETYDAYRRNMERVGGDPFPRPFFQALTEDLPERTMAFTATVDGDVVGQLIHLVNEEQSSLVYYASAIGDEANYEYNPSELLHERAMRWGMEEGFETYDFGTTGADFSDGLFRYKERYGGELLPVLHWRRGTSTLLWLGFRASTRLYQKNKY